MALKDWKDRPFGPDTGETPRQYEDRLDAYAVANPGVMTPLSAAALEDLEARAQAAVDAVDIGGVKLSVDQTVASVKTLSRGLKIVDRYFSDDFERSDRALAGDVAPTGQAWATGGAAASITSGRYVNDGNTYANVTLAEKPLRAGGKFSYVAGGGADTTPAMMVALVLSNGAGLLSDMVHLQWSRLSGRLSLWTGAASTPPVFAATTLYPAGTVIVEAASRYVANKTFTSGGAFVAADWTLLGANVAADSPMFSGDSSTAQIIFDTPLVAGVEYEVQMTVAGDQVHIEFLRDGVVFASADSSDPRVSAVSGPTVIWQIKTVSNASSAYVYRWHEVNAVRQRLTGVESELDAPAGVNGPIGTKFLSAVYARRVGVGTQAPTNPLDVLYVSGNPLSTARIRARGTTCMLELASEGAGIGAEIVFRINGTTPTSAPRIRSTGGAMDLDFIVGFTAASRLALPASISGGGIHLKGVPRWFTSSLEQTTVGAAGTAAAPPAAPAKWLKVMDSAGTAMVIPAYPAA